MEEKKPTDEQYSVLSEFSQALFLSATMNYLLSGFVSLVVAHQSHGSFALVEYADFFWKFILISSFTTLVFATIYFVARRLAHSVSRYIKWPKILLTLSIAPILCLNLLMIVTQCMMYLEYGEGINYELFNLFGEDGMTVFNYLDRNYYITWWLIAATIGSVCIYLGLDHLIKKILLRLRTKSLKISSIVIVILAISGYLFGNSQLFLIRHNLSILARDHGLSTLKLFNTNGTFFHNNHKRILQPYLLRGEPNTYLSAINITNADPSSIIPSEAFPRTISDPKKERPFDLLKKPSHIFYIQLEGHDSIVMRDSELAQLSPHLHQYAKEGMSVPNFYSTGIGTNSSTVSTLLTFPPVSGRRRPNMLKNKGDLSLQKQLTKHFGYSSSMHSASPYDSADHGSFLKVMEPNSIVNYSDKFSEDKWANVWGISDDVFVTEIIKNYNADSTEFAFFMPVSNHPPFKFDVYKFGYSDTFLPKSRSHFFEKGGFDPQVRAGHYFYADQQMHRLVQHLHSRHPDALFIITADHWSRYANNPKDPLANYNIPLVFWGPNIIPSEQNKPQHDWYGSHMNIASTLIHLLAEKPLDYHAFGAPLWNQEKYFFCRDAAGDKNSIYLIDRGKLMDYRQNKVIQSEKKQFELMRWHAAVSFIGHKILFNDNQWEQKQ